jgi:translation initiation factor 2B subunit (eIF-2B alpha/beta/delta family)
MTREDTLILHSLMREHEDVLGSSRSTLLALGSFMAAVQELACPPDQLREQYLELTEAIKMTRPKVIPLIHLIEEFEREMEPHYSQDPDTVKQTAIEILQAKYDKLQEKSGKIIELGLTCIDPKDMIVVHAANANVIGIITLAHQVMGKEINVIVLQQNLAKTKRMISQLRQSNVRLQAVPEYSLSHYIGKANKMFCGALSITTDHQVLAPVGTANIASLCHFHQVPVYLFANTLKFAHGVTADQRIHRESVTQDKHDQAYELITYSHDVVDLKMVDFLITEEGVYPQDKIAAYLDNFYASQSRI